MSWLIFAASCFTAGATYQTIPTMNPMIRPIISTLTRQQPVVVNILNNGGTHSEGAHGMTMSPFIASGRDYLASMLQIRYMITARKTPPPSSFASP